MEHIEVKSIGCVERTANGFRIRLEADFIPALKHVADFSHLQIVWWGHKANTAEQRKVFLLKGLFKKGPKEVGVFATRSPFRPNPLLISTIMVDHVDLENGIIATPFIDADAGSPILDIKPYFPMDRVKTCSTPAWCRHWPEWADEAPAFDWSQEINF